MIPMRSLISIALLLLASSATAMDSLSYYTSALGLDASADVPLIRKRYRQLSLQLHPDKNPGDEAAHDKFIKAVEAYEILLEMKKTKTAEDQALLRQGHDGLNTIRRFQQQFDKTGAVPGLGGVRRVGRAKDTENNAAISYETFANGDDLYFTRKKQVVCPHCSGQGGHNLQKCPNCGGSGLHMVTTPGGGMTVTGCGVCGGAGALGRCNACGGKGTIRVDKNYHIHVDQGMPIGHKITFVGDGDEQVGADFPGDYVVELKEARHDTYKRDGNNLYVIVRVPRSMPPPIDVTLQSLTKQPLKFTHPGPVTQGDTMTMAGEGMAYRTETGELARGTLSVVFDLR